MLLSAVIIRGPLSIATDSMALAGFSGTSYSPTSTLVIASMTPDFSRYRWNSSFLGSPPLCEHGANKQRHDDRAVRKRDSQQQQQQQQQSRNTNRSVRSIAIGRNANAPAIQSTVVHAYPTRCRSVSTQ